VRGLPEHLFPGDPAGYIDVLSDLVQQVSDESQQRDDREQDDVHRRHERNLLLNRGGNDEGHAADDRNGNECAGGKVPNLGFRVIVHQELDFMPLLQSPPPRICSFGEQRQPSSRFSTIQQIWKTPLTLENAVLFCFRKSSFHKEG
jgi:hypothetical protein